MSKTIKTKCPVTSESIIIEILEPGSRILTHKRDSEGRCRLIPRKETEYPKYLIHCPSAESPYLVNRPSTLKISLIDEEKWWCKKKQIICPNEQFMPDLLERL